MAIRLQSIACAAGGDYEVCLDVDGAELRLMCSVTVHGSIPVVNFTPEARVLSLGIHPRLIVQVVTRFHANAMAIEEANATRAVPE